jgi:hypothetical protein
MSDEYKMSVCVEELTPAEANWSISLLETCETAVRVAGRPRDKSIYDNPKLVPPHLAEYVKRIDPCHTGVGRMHANYVAELGWLSIFGRPELPFIEALLTEILQKFGHPKAVGFRWTLGNYGGGATVVTKHEVKTLDTEDWLYDQLELIDAIE